MEKSPNPLAVLLGVGAGLVLAGQLVRRVRLTSQADFFTGQVAIITGASRGIGRILALELAQRGAHVVLAARSVDALQAVAAECQSFSAQTLVIPTDVADADQLARLTNQTVERFERIDIVINNAGIVQGGPLIEDEGLVRFRRQMEINLFGAVALTRFALPTMLQQGSGWVVNISSIMGRFAMPNTIGYAASKFAMNGFGDGLRRELHGSGVRVLNMIAGFVETDMIAGPAGDAVRSSPMSIVSPEQVAQQVLDGIILGKAQVYTGYYEAMMSWLSMAFPLVSDSIFAALSPDDLHMIAAGHATN